MENLTKGGTGSVIRNHNREWIIEFSRSYLRATNNQKELLSFRVDLKVVKEKNIFLIIINTDSLEVLNMLKNGNSHYNPIFNKCRLILRRLGGPSTTWSNGVADALAKSSALIELYEWILFFVFPPMYAPKYA